MIGTARLPRSIREAGLPYRKTGKAAEQLMSNLAARRYEKEQRAADREAAARAEGIQASMAQERLRGEQLRDLQRLRGRQQAGLAEAEGARKATEAERQRAFEREQAGKQRMYQLEDVGLKLFGEGRITPEQAYKFRGRPERGPAYADIRQILPALQPSRAGRQPDMLKARNELFEQFYGKGRGGKVLRDKYDGDFDRYVQATLGTGRLREEEPVGRSLPPAPAQASMGGGEITRRGMTFTNVQPTVSPQEAEDYAQSLLLGRRQQQVEKPTGRFDVDLPAVEDVEFDTFGPFTEADRIPGVSRELPQRTQTLLKDLRQFGEPVDLLEDRRLRRQQEAARKSFVRSRPY